MADIGPAGARTGDLLCIREADEPVALAIVCSSRIGPDGMTVLVVVQDPWGPDAPAPSELEGGPPVTP